MTGIDSVATIERFEIVRESEQCGLLLLEALKEYGQELLEKWQQNEERREKLEAAVQGYRQEREDLERSLQKIEELDHLLTLPTDENHSGCP